MTIKEIAEYVGVSRATVYRVLNNHPYVKPEIREKIQRVIEKYDCSPSAAGKALAMKNKNFKISIIVNDRQDAFYSAVCQGVYEAYEQIKDSGITIEILEIFSISPEKEANIIRQAVSGSTSALAVCPLQTEEVEEAVRELSDSQIPLVTYSTDLLSDKRLFFVGHKNYQSGRTCGYMMDTYLHGKGKVLVFEALMHYKSHRQRLDGFSGYLREHAPGLQVVGCLDDMNDDALAYRQAKQALTETPDIEGIYVISRGMKGIVQALRELHLEKKIRIIGYDLIPENEQYLREGIVDMVIQQNPVLQGRKIVEVLYQYFINGKKPVMDSYLTDSIMVVKENLE